MTKFFTTGISILIVLIGGLSGIITFDAFAQINESEVCCGDQMISQKQINAYKEVEKQIKIEQEKIIQERLEILPLSKQLSQGSEWFCSPNGFRNYETIIKNENVFTAQILATDLVLDDDYGTVLFQTTKIYKGDFDRDWPLHVTTMSILDGPPFFAYYKHKFENDSEKQYLFASNENFMPFPIGCGADEFEKIHSFGEYRFIHAILSWFGVK